MHKTHFPYDQRCYKSVSAQLDGKLLEILDVHTAEHDDVESS